MGRVDALNTKGNCRGGHVTFMENLRVFLLRLNILPPPSPLDPSAMCFLVNTAGPVPLSPSVHKRSPRLQGKEVCRWVVHVCLWASGPRHCYSAHVGAAESICADPWRRWSDHSKGAKKGSLVITSIYNPLLSLESVSPRRCARIETCQLSQMICVGVREEWIIWAFSGWWCKTKAEGPSRRPLRTLIEIRSAVRGVFTGAAFNLTTSRFLLSDLERKCFKLHGWFELETPSDAFVNIFNASMVIIFKACAGFFLIYNWHWIILMRFPSAFLLNCNQQIISQLL